MGLLETEFLQAYLDALGIANATPLDDLNSLIARKTADLNPASADFGQVLAQISDAYARAESLKPAVEQITDAAQTLANQLAGFTTRTEQLNLVPPSPKTRRDLLESLIQGTAADIRETHGDQEARAWLEKLTSAIEPVPETVRGEAEPLASDQSLSQEQGLATAQRVSAKLAAQLEVATAHPTIPPVDNWYEVMRDEDYGNYNTGQLVTNAFRKFADPGTRRKPSDIVGVVSRLAAQLTPQDFVPRFSHVRAKDQATAALAVLANAANRGLPTNEQAPRLAADDSRVKSYFTDKILPAVKDGADNGVDVTKPVSWQTLDYVRALNQRVAFETETQPVEALSVSQKITLSIPIADTSHLLAGLGALHNHERNSS